MATISLVDDLWTWYKKGISGYSRVFGYEDGSRRVARVRFVAPDIGATHLQLTIHTGGRGAGNHIPIKFYIGEDPNSHANAGVESVSTGEFTLQDDWLTFKAEADILLIPNKTYYLWIFPGADTFGWYWGTRLNYTSEIITSGAAESTIGATDANIGSKSSIVITKNSADHMHSIRYQFGELVGYITKEGGISTKEVIFSTPTISFTIPLSFYTQIPNSKTGKCILSCLTYLNNTPIGNAKTTEFVVTASKSLCTPVVRGVVIDSNSKTLGLTGDENTLVKYFSDAACTISAEAKNGATIVTKKIGGTEVIGHTRTLFGVETDSITFWVEDSRGYTNSQIYKLAMVNYIKLTANVQLTRTDPTSGNAILRVKGNYFNDSFGQVDNTLEMWYRLAKSGDSYGDWVQVFPTLDGNSYTLSVSLGGLDYRYPYSLELRVEDKLISKDVVVSLNKGIPVVDWGENDFRFNVPFLIPDSSKGSTLPSTGKKGQVFFLRNSDGSYSIRIHDGTSW